VETAHNPRPFVQGCELTFPFNDKGRYAPPVPGHCAECCVLAPATDKLFSILESLFLPYSSEVQDLRVAQYSPRYRLSFSLLNEDAAAGSVALGWEVKAAINGIFHSYPVAVN
jgi:hypothetical protein